MKGKYPNREEKPTRKPKFKPEITRVKLNPEQAVLACTCYTSAAGGPWSIPKLGSKFNAPLGISVCDTSQPTKYAPGRWVYTYDVGMNLS